jgi:ParB/RepB/Spo0J family partition protein
MDQPIAIPLDQLQEHPDNPRLTESEEIIAQIANSIRSSGGYDPAHAIKVRPYTGKYQIVSGHNRTKAARAAGLTEIPAWVRDMTDEQAYMLLITDNAQRELQPLERGIHAMQVVQKGSHSGLSIEKYAKLVGRDPAAIRREIHAAEVACSLENVPDENRTRVRISPNLFDFSRQLSEIYAAPRDQWPGLVQQMETQGWTVKQAHAEVKKLRTSLQSSESTFTLEAWKKLSSKRQQQIINGWQGRNYGSKFDINNDDSSDWAKFSWNPVTGCQYSCPYCVARDIAEDRYTEKFQPTLRIEQLAAPYETGLPPLANSLAPSRNVMVCSMADLFGQWVPNEWIEGVLTVVSDNPQWNFVFLTKYPIRMAEFDYPPNVWLGVTVDLQARVKDAEEGMRKVNAPVKFLCVEPFIEPLQFADLSAFSWVVIGGASKSSRTPEWRPPRPWVWDLTMKAHAAGCLVYHKGNLAEHRLKEFPGHPEAEPTEAPEVLRYLKQGPHDDVVRIEPRPSGSEHLEAR